MVDLTQFAAGGAEIRYIQRPTPPPPVRNLGKGRYININTGQWGRYRSSEQRSQNADSLRKTFRKLRALINNNFEGTQNELAITLTYAENMTDHEKLHRDFKAFYKRLCRRYGKLEYLNVVEPQARGAWHCHVLLKSPDKGTPLFIPADDLAQIWGHGFVKVRRMESVTNLGAYLSAYLGDVEICQDNDDYLKTLTGSYEIKEVEKDGQTKRYVKGARLHLYPSGMNIFRKSRGIIEPQAERLPYWAAKKKTGAATPVYKTASEIADQQKSYNTIVHEYYNKRKEGTGMNITVNGDLVVNIDGQTITKDLQDAIFFTADLVEGIADDLATSEEK